MNKQVFDNSDSQLPQGWQASSGDEIDLRELILVLWRQKVLILLITSVFAGAGIAYALLAPRSGSARPRSSRPPSRRWSPSSSTSTSWSMLRYR
ncbi:Wzz/FepE/Etk N-terminal domain-containing protein [Aeromonas caviae]|uniref:Wzz/FepE/Etk N-terminal domain-containing protein n=1 Tax=Aeromonas caviae TaxID=648 RepID=UPI0029D70988|nr:Wzz/FepE/Etk N-terminal domain-containing protein [Aeromonas caviae]MDX7712790.1 Wzz/FepE/Etk N-terminal domain-containing protein [Aeromonas caviae]